MNDGLLKVDFAAMQNAGVDIASALVKLKNELAQLESDAAPLVSTWKSEAQEAYAVRQKTWSTAADDLSEILRKIQGAVNDATTDYQDTEKRATQRFS